MAAFNIDPHKLFGTDGVRGKANAHPMSVELVLALGRAAGVIFRRHGEQARVVLGKDTRLSCYMFENALIAGLCSMGVKTIMLGPTPTPAVAFLTRALRADAGIMISASHNPYTDNGIKFFSAEGFKLPDEMELEIAQLVAANDFAKFLPAPDQIGRNFKSTDADGRYIEFSKATLPKRMSLNKLKVVLDCANGASYRVAPPVFRELDAQLFVYGDKPDGLNINADCGSLHPQLVQKAVIEHGAHVGIALDGDGDRVILVDENAQIVDGDTILAICAADLARRGALTGNVVVGTIMSNHGLVTTLEKLGVQLIRAPVGDRHVISAMREYNAKLGGEQSGHMIFMDYNTTGDGLVSALQVLKIMIETDSKLSELSAQVERYPQALVNVAVASKPPLEDLEHVREAIIDVERKLGSLGRVLVRYSGTENICRVMVEGPKAVHVQQYAKAIAKTIQHALAS